HVGEDRSVGGPKARSQYWHRSAASANARSRLVILRLRHAPAIPARQRPRSPSASADGRDSAWDGRRTLQQVPIQLRELTGNDGATEVVVRIFSACRAAFSACWTSESTTRNSCPP